MNRIGTAFLALSLAACGGNISLFPGTPEQQITPDVPDKSAANPSSAGDPVRHEDRPIIEEPPGDEEDDPIALPLTYATGSPEIIYTVQQRGHLGLGYWPDGNIGIVPLGGGRFDFHAANGATAVKTTGTLTRPAESKQVVQINGLKNQFNYVAGGPILVDAASGRRLMIYHAEQSTNGGRDYYSMIGLAISTDNQGLYFQDLGVIVVSNLPNQERQFSIDVGGGPLVVMDGYVYVYYRDYLRDGGNVQLAVARASLESVLSSATNLTTPQFTKYYSGEWSQPGIGGIASPLEVGNPGNSWASVAYSDYFDGMVMIIAQPSSSGSDLYMSTSKDGINWSARQPIVVQEGEQFYPSLIGTGSRPAVIGSSFYVYYTHSIEGSWNRWRDAQLVRRLITLDPDEARWATVAGFRRDFQTGQPRAGWKYAWTSSGNSGVASTYASLRWSAVAGVYNTTGGATPIYTGGPHNDDYLSLNAQWGHPGRPNYNVVVGYTIQDADDGGNFRLTNGSISKIDYFASPGEDGLDMIVYVNDARLGVQNVSLDGSTLNFAYDLGRLNKGDTVYVLIAASANQTYDTFKNFDFRIEKRN